ncbi:hypothetical protein K402DRAFT_367087, partial [Aulographum hederae CBS 113979]
MIDLCIETFELDSAPDFWTLSYVWGSAEFPMPIIVEGKKLEVTENLYDFLDMFHPLNQPISEDFEADPGVWYWIDAICIDQSNLGERSKQVTLMGRLYQESVATIAWSGPAGERSWYAIPLIKELAEGFQETEGIEFVREMLWDPDNRAPWIALDKFFRRDWWSRVWIRQEYVLPKGLLLGCGSQWVSGREVIDALDCISEAINLYSGILNSTEGPPPNLRPEEPDSDDEDASEDRRPHGLIMGNPGLDGAKASSRLVHSFFKGVKLPLWKLLDEITDVQSTDPKDQVYGLLGLACDSHHLVPKPDYSLSTAEVYATLVKNYVEHYKSLDIICYQAYPKNLPDLPSWVPDWSSRTNSVNHMCTLSTDAQAYQLRIDANLAHGEGKPVPYCAAGDSVPKSRFSADLKELTVSGFVLDTIDSLAFGRKLNMEEFAIQQADESTLTSSESGGRSHVTPMSSEQVRDALWHSLILDRYHGQPVGAGEDFDEAFDTIFSRAAAGIKDPASFFPDWYEHNKSFVIHGRSLEEWAAEWLGDGEVPKEEEGIGENARVYTLDIASVMFYKRKR